jgi:hypothetical protein
VVPWAEVLWCSHVWSSVEGDGVANEWCGLDAVFDIVVVLTGEEEAWPRWPPCSDACDVGKECPSPFWEEVQGQTKWVLVTVVVTTFQSVSVCPWHNPTAPAMTVAQNSPFILKVPTLRSTETNGRRRDVTKSEWMVLAGPSSNTTNTRQESEESIFRRYELRSEKDGIRALLQLDQKQRRIQRLDGRQTILSPRISTPPSVQTRCPLPSGRRYRKHRTCG